MAARHANEMLRYYRDKAGLTEEALGYALRLQDCRGTAATRLLNAGLSLAEIASHMGWSVRYAAAVIELYARVSPEESDAILVKLSLWKGGYPVNTTVNGCVNARLGEHEGITQVTEN